MWMFTQLNEDLSKCFTVSLLLQTTWHAYLRYLCAGSSSWTWMLKLSSLNLHTWQVVLMGRQHPHLLWETCVREGWGETTALWQAGDFPSRTGLDLFIGPVTLLSWETILSPLNSADLSCPSCHVILQNCSLVFFCLLSCHCLSGSGTVFALERYAGRWVCLLNFSLQGGLLQSFKLSVSCHVMLMLPGKSVISVFCRYIVSAINFKTFSRIDGADSIWLPVLQAFFPFLLLILQWIFGL